MRDDLQLIVNWIPSQSRVLDLGCGDGEQLSYMQKDKEVSGLGLEIDQDKIISCIEKKVSVVQQNIDTGLANLQDRSFDMVVMSQSLQQLKAPKDTLDELMRVGKEAIVTFPNFGHWSTRRYLGFLGRMPMSNVLPHRWFNTPNIHLCTFKDFEALCEDLGIEIIKRTVVDSKHRARWFINLLPNLLGEIAVYHIRRIKNS
jgi:methionine biosynthesis protein MetW